MSRIRLHSGRPFVAVAVLAGALALTAGCTPKGGAATSTPTPTPASSASASATDTPTPSGTGTGMPVAQGAVNVERTGGIAGISQLLTVDVWGAWTLAPARGPQQSGTLTKEQDAKLKTLIGQVTNGEGTTKPATSNCADGFTYTVTTATATVSWLDCGSATAAKPVTSSQIVQLLSDWTAM